MVEGLKVELDEKFVVHGAPFLVLDFLSFPAVGVDSDVAASGAAQMGVTSKGLAEKS